MKVIVLGGGYCQLNMIRRLKNNGHYIILVDYLDSNPGKDIADIHKKISTFDAPAVSDLAYETKAEAIITMGTDQPVLSAAVAAEYNGLSFYVDPLTAVAVTNKWVMKDEFTENGIPTANYRLIGINYKPDELEGIKFPAVLKPVDSQGQRGVFKVESPDEINLHIAETLSYSDESKALLEEYYHNDEITVSGWVKDGQANIISVVDRVTMTNGNRIGICIAHNYPSLHYEKYQDDIKVITQGIVDAFGIDEGPLYFQYLIGSEGILVNEIAMRVGGAYEDIAIPIYSGIDILGLVMDNVMNREPDTVVLDDYDLDKNNRFLSVQMFFIRQGIIRNMTPADELEKMDCVHKAMYLVKEGDKMDDIKNATARAGYFIVSGSSYENLMSNVSAVFNKLRILDDEGNNIVIPYGGYKDRYKFISDPFKG